MNDLKIEFEPSWLNDKKKLKSYCYYLQRCHLLKIESLESYREIISMAIKDNNTEAIDVVIESFHEFDRGGFYDNVFVLSIAATCGNLKTFKHCLKIYMNEGENDALEYKYLQNHPDPDVANFINKLQDLIIDGELPSTFSDNINTIDFRDNEYVYKIKSYRKIMNQ